MLGSLCAITSKDDDAESAMLASWISQVCFTCSGTAVLCDPALIHQVSLMPFTAIFGNHSPPLCPSVQGMPAGSRPHRAASLAHTQQHLAGLQAGMQSAKASPLPA